MCLIAVKPVGSRLPKEEYLRNANQKNSDGVGIALWKDGATEVHIKKDFPDIEAFLKFLNENVEEKDACIIHFRFATHGLKDVGNRHPFPITKNGELLRKPELKCQFAVAHNGVIKEYGIHSTYSDTQKFVMDILANDVIKNNLTDKTVTKLINNFIDGDRLAIMNKDGHIYTFGNFEEEDGIFYSNTGYKWGYVYREKFNNWWHHRYTDYSKYKTTKTEQVDKDTDNDNETFNFTCEGCGKYRPVKIVPESSDNGLYLCKACRKQFKKGKLKTFVETDAKKVTLPCDNCQSNFTKAELTNRDGMSLCPTCLKEYDDAFKDTPIQNN